MSSLLRTIRLVAGGCLLAIIAGACAEPTPAPKPLPPKSVVTITTVEVEPARGSLEVGERLQLTAIARDVDGAVVADRPTTWSSDHPATAIVDEMGLLRAVAMGETRVIATVDGIQGAVEIEVRALELERIEVAPPVATIRLGESLELRALAFDSAGSEMIDAAMVWESQDAEIVTVDEDGIATAHAIGETTVTASSAGKMGIATIAVVQMPVERISLSATALTLEAGQKASLSATPFDGRDTPLEGREVIWGVLDASVATVSPDGLVSAIRAGQTVVFASAEDVVATCTVAVTPAPVASVEVLSPRPQILLGVPLQLSARVLDQYGNELTGRQIAWSSSDPEVADVDTTGLVQPLSTGTAIITAIVEGQQGTLAVEVERLQFTSVDAGGLLACGIAIDGRAYCWGSWPTAGGHGSGPTSYIPAPLSTTIQFVQVSVGVEHVCALTAEGEVWCIGPNRYGELGDGTSLGSDSLVRAADGMVFRALYSGSAYTCGLTGANEAWCWGSNYRGELGTGDNIDSAVPRRVAGGHLFSQLSLSRGTIELNSTCGITTLGEGWCWGENGGGQLGNGTLISTNVPERVRSSLAFASISVDAYIESERPGSPRLVHAHGCATDVSGKAWCWGANGRGQLGNGTLSNSLVPVMVPGSIDFEMISVSGATIEGVSCGLDTAGGAYCWGSNDFGQLGGGTGRVSSSLPQAVSGGIRFVQITRGRQVACALSDQESIWCWGWNDFGQAGRPPSGPISVEWVPALVAGQALGSR